MSSESRRDDWNANTATSRPYGARTVLLVQLTPSSELLGYFRLSLRDKDMRVATKPCCRTDWTCPRTNGRIGAAVIRPLESLEKVVNKFLFELEAQLAEKQVTLSVDESARNWLAEHGYDPKMGARPMARLIQEKIKKPLAEELLFGDLVQGGHVHITLEDGEFNFAIEVGEVV